MKPSDQYIPILTKAKEQDCVEGAMRRLALSDLFFLLVFVLGRKDADRDWLYDRCREVQDAPDGFLDLWAREHYKSTIITYAKTIQDILNNPEITVGIFSHTRPIAKGFLRQIKREFEGNNALKALFPDILYADPQHQSPKWSEDDGIIVKRKGNPKEATVEAWGLVDGQPTSKHFRLLVYDDVVTRESVTTSDMISKVTDAWALSLNLGADGGKVRIIGTRYHFNDTYKVMLDRGSVTPRIFPATDNGKDDGVPVLLDTETLVKKRRDMGPYVFSCFVADTPILMGDWTQKRLADIISGDTVVGYTFGVKGQRAELAPAKVLAVNSRVMPIVRFTFESGLTLDGTRDHKFWHGRAERGYSEIGLDYHSLKAACSIYDPRNVFYPYPNKDSGYLAGLFDGEGSVTGSTVHIAQSNEINPGVCERIENVFDACGISYNCSHPKSRPGHNEYYVTGGRTGHMRFLHVIGDSAKRNRLISKMFKNGTRNIGNGARDKLVSIEDLGEAEVFNIQTETGNYIANGYAVKNCQMLQDPAADKAQGFKSEWLRFYSPKGLSGLNLYLLCDPAGEKKRENDYTVMLVMALGQDENYYLIDGLRDRLNLTERTERLMHFHRKYRPIRTGYEKYGKDSDIEHIKDEQDRKNYRFEIVPLGGAMPKFDRIRTLVPIFETGRMFMPSKLYFIDYEGKQRDLVNEFINDEYSAFPVSLHDDILDCMARIRDPLLKAQFPEKVTELQQVYDLGMQQKYDSLGHMTSGSGW